MKKEFTTSMNRKVCYEAGYEECKEDVIKLMKELQDKASNERKISKDKRYWLGCCQILNELKARIEG